MARSIVGFHYGPLADQQKHGIGDFMRRLNEKGIPFLMKGADHAGICFEAQELGMGVDNWLIYRTSSAGQEGHEQYDVPEYTLAPAEAAARHWQKTVAKWPPELNPAVVWMEPINEPRAKVSTPEDRMFDDMHPVDWLGKFMLAYAHIANNANPRFKVCGPSFNSGEPEVFGPNEYEQPGMLDYLRYCAEHPEQAALSVHEYYRRDWESGTVEWDPFHWGRLEGAFAAADKHHIPRTFHVFVTEWGFGFNNAPRWPACEPYLTLYNEWAARWPQVKGAASWSLQGGEFSEVAKDVHTWIAPLTDYARARQFDRGEQPARVDPRISTAGPPDHDEGPDGGDEDELPVMGGAWKDAVWAAAESGATLNASAALAAFILNRPPWKPYGVEKWTEPIGGVQYAAQAAVDWNTLRRRVAYCVVPEWHKVRWLDEEPVTPGQQKELDVPYLSQWGPNATGQKDCGPASVAMVLNWFGTAATIDAVAHVAGGDPEADGFSVDQLLQALNHYNVDAKFEGSLTLKQVRDFIDQGQPVILLIRYGDIPGRQDTGFTGGHFFVVVGYGEDADGPYFLTNDPDFWGERAQEGHQRRVAAAALEQAMANTTAFATPRQGIVIRGRRQPDQPVAGNVVDLLPFMLGDARERGGKGTLYEVQSNHGQERYQVQLEGNRIYITKNNQWEEWAFDDKWIYLGRDTSPGPAPANAERPGAPRYYHQWEEGKVVDGRRFSRMWPRHMRVNQTWVQPVDHRVQFYYKDDGAKSAINSGIARNGATLFGHFAEKEINGQTFHDVILIGREGGEKHYFGGGLGRLGWEAAWGTAHVSEVHAPGARPDNVREQVATPH